MGHQADAVISARAALAVARQVYLAAVQRACTAGTPTTELRADAGATHSAAQQLIDLDLAQRLVPGRVAA